MTDQDPKPVPVYIIPRFDSEGRPSCYGCPLGAKGVDCHIRASQSEQEGNCLIVYPGPDCPIHNPQEQQEPL